jgi:hypothetical protein
VISFSEIRILEGFATHFLLCFEEKYNRKILLSKNFCADALKLPLAVTCSLKYAATALSWDLGSEERNQPR